MNVLKSVLIASVVVLVFTLAIIAVFVATTMGDSAEDNPVSAVVVFQNINSSITGTLMLTQNSSTNSVEILGTIENLLPNTTHGFHVHESGDLRNGCTSTGSHFNPYNKRHGDRNEAVRHVGDLGNVQSDEKGTAHIEIRDKIISLSGPNSIIGRAIVIHEKEDDLGLGGNEGSLTTGNAGGRLACGIVFIANSNSVP